MTTRSLMINGKLIQHLSCHKGLTCPPCIPDSHGGFSVRIFKSDKALLQHWRKSHTLSNDEFEKLKILLKKYRNDSFVQYCYDRGYRF